MPTSRRVIALSFCLFLLPLSLSAQRIVSEISGNFDTYGLAINTVTSKIYVVSDMDDDVIVIDGATNQITGTAPVGRGPGRPTVDSVANKIYVPNTRDNTITIINGATLATTTVNVGIVPAAIAVNPVTNKIYVANADDNTVTVIDGRTLATTTIAVDEGPLAIAINTTTNKIYVGNQRFYSHSTVTVIDGATNHTTLVNLPYEAYFYTGPNALMVNEATNQIYALGYIGLYDIDGSSNQVDLFAQWSDFCVENMAMNPVTNHMYGADCDGNVDDVDLSSGITNQISTFSENLFISVDAVRNRAYTLDPYEFILTAIDLNLNSVIFIQTVIDSENAIATNSSTGMTYFGNNGGVTVVAAAAPMQFVPVTPCRVLDTRNSGGPIQGGTKQDVPLTSPPCNIPATASAYSLNVTLVPAGGPVGYLTIWPTDQYRPTVSTMNSLDGRVKADAAIVSAGTLGAVSVYVSDTTNVVIDINGYFMPNAGSTLAFYPLTPCRVFDTRDANGSLGGPYLNGGAERDFPLLDSPCLPPGVTPQAYSLNFTAVPHQSGQSLSYLTVWPQGQTKPLVSTLNNPAATVVANAAVVPAGQNGKIAVFPSDNTDLVADINGYFAAPASGGLSLYASPPCRVIDTRQHGGPFIGDLTVYTGCFTSSAAQAYVFNATVVPPGSLGYLTLYPDGQERPLASTLNAIDGAITSNMAIVSTTNGSIDAFASGWTNLILDISSYFAP